MSRWTHAICPPCARERHPGKILNRVPNPPTEPCCYCTEPTNSGMYDREDPRVAPCHAAGGTHEDDT